MRSFFVLTALATATLATPILARTIVVEMKDKGADGTMVFEPGYVRAEPGDVIRFVPTNPAHNAETIADLLPAGTTPIKGRFNQMVELKVSVPGLYGIRCLPHYFMGMVALVQVGKAPFDLAAFRATTMPPLAKARMTKYLARVR